MAAQKVCTHDFSSVTTSDGLAMTIVCSLQAAEPIEAKRKQPTESETRRDMATPSGGGPLRLRPFDCQGPDACQRPEIT
jgi:hypothetical protein